MVGRRTIGVFLMVLLSLAAAPTAPAQGFLSVVQEADGTTIVAVRIPASGAALDGVTAQFPLAEGILAIEVEKVLLGGPGGSMDVEAYLAQANLLLDGLTTPLPSLIVIPQGDPFEESTTAALQELAREMETLQVELEAAAAGTESESDELHDAALEAAAEAAWIHAMSAEAASLATSAAEEEAPMLFALVSRVESGLELLDPLIDHLEEEGDAAVPDVPPAVTNNIAKAQQKVEAGLQKAEEAKALLAQKIDNARAVVDDLVDEQAALDAARVALEGALLAIDDAADHAQAEAEETAEDAQARLESEKGKALKKVEFLNGLVEKAADRDDVQKAADMAEAALDETLAPLQWARDWVDAAHAWGDASKEATADDALAAIDRSIARLEAARALVEKYRDQNVQPSLDEALAEVPAALASVQDELDAAQGQLEAALKDVEGIAGGLDPSANHPDGPEATVCFEPAAASLCFQYASPDDEADKEIVLLVAIPALSVPDLSSLPATPLPSASAPTLVVPSASTPAASAPTLNLPGATTPTASTATVPTLISGKPKPSVGLPSLSQDPAGSDGPELTEENNQNQPAHAGLEISTVPATIDVQEGQQGVLTIRLRNTGTATDTFRVTLHTDAPVTADASQEKVVVEPGKHGSLSVRLTPLTSGSGTLKIVATGDLAGTVRHQLPVTVSRLPPAAADIFASLEPDRIHSLVGQQTLLTIELANRGSALDHIELFAAGEGVTVQPSVLQASLAPGESVVRQVRLTPTQEGEVPVTLRLESEKGAHLQPIVILDVDSQALGLPEEPAPPAKKGSTPGFGAVLVAAAALAVVALTGARRRP